MELQQYTTSSKRVPAPRTPKVARPAPGDPLARWEPRLAVEGAWRIWDRIFGFVDPGKFTSAKVTWQYISQQNALAKQLLAIRGGPPCARK